MEQNHIFNFKTYTEQLKRIYNVCGWKYEKSLAKDAIADCLRWYSYDFLMYGYIHKMESNDKFKIFLEKPEYFILFFKISRKVGDELFPFVKQIESHLASSITYILGAEKDIQKNNGHIHKDNTIDFFRKITVCDDKHIGFLINKLVTDLQNHSHGIWFDRFRQENPTFNEEKDINLNEINIFLWPRLLSFSASTRLFRDMNEEYQNRVISNFYESSGKSNKNFNMMLDFLVKFRNYLAHGDASCFVDEEMLYQGRKDMDEIKTRRAINDIIGVKQMLGLATNDTINNYSIDIVFFINIIDSLYFTRNYEHTVFSTVGDAIAGAKEMNGLVYSLPEKEADAIIEKILIVFTGNAYKRTI